jgi:hypothetical protein
VRYLGYGTAAVLHGGEGFDHGDDALIGAGCSGGIGLGSFELLHGLFLSPRRPVRMLLWIPDSGFGCVRLSLPNTRGVPNQNSFPKWFLRKLLSVLE